MVTHNPPPFSLSYPTQQPTAKRTPPRVSTLPPPGTISRDSQSVKRSGSAAINPRGRPATLSPREAKKKKKVLSFPRFGVLGRTADH